MLKPKENKTSERFETDGDFKVTLQFHSMQKRTQKAGKMGQMQLSQLGRMIYFSAMAIYMVDRVTS